MEGGSNYNSHVDHDSSNPDQFVSGGVGGRSLKRRHYDTPPKKFLGQLQVGLEKSQG